MKIETTCDAILGLMDRPAFCVSDGIIQSANRAALDLMIPVGSPVAQLLHTDGDIYHEFSSGCIRLTVCLMGQLRICTVTRMGEIDVFALDTMTENAPLRTLSIAAQELRQPLGHIMHMTDRLFPQLAPDVAPEIAQQFSKITRCLYQMLRIVGNMSDAPTAGVSRMEIRDVAGLAAEVMEHVTALLADSGIRIRFSNYPGTLFSLVDTQKLERAIYNLISNALSHTPPGEEISVSLTLRKRQICFIVTDPGNGSQVTLSSDLFSRYLREPGFSMEKTGVGLGLTIAQSVAFAHKGTLLVHALPSGGVRATLSFPIRQNCDGLRTPTLRVDYAGERDHALVELSEFLPPDLYSHTNL